jgi:hypothetical protein
MVISRSSFGKLTATPPKRGPQPQGLNIEYKKIKTITEKINANRQSTTKRTANYKPT